METRCKASAFPQGLGSLRLPHFPQPRRRNHLQTINQGVGPFYSIGVGPFYVVKEIIGARGEAFVNERANAMGFMFSRYGPLEAGIDGLLEIRDPDTGAATGQLVAVQVKTKAGGSYTAETDSGFEYLMEESDVAYWRGCNLPVIVALVHLEKRTAYWKVADAGVDAEKRRLRIDKTSDRFDINARDAIATLCVARGGFGVWFPPLKTEENGHLNLLEVALPDTAYVGASPFKRGRQALYELLDHEERPPYDWIIRDGHFISFRDPREGALTHIVDIGSIEEIASEEVAFPDEEPDEHAIIDLLRRTLSTQLDGVLTFNRKQRAFYFPAVQDTIKRSYQYKSLQQRTSADVVKKYEKGGKLKYVRHHAFEPRFWRIGDQWFLLVTPTFVFTWDGFRPDKFASDRLARKKQFEYNSALTGQFAMWRYLLCGDDQNKTSSLFDLEPKAGSILKFLPLNPLSLPRSVPDDLWRASESAAPQSTGQRRFTV